ncbi:MAG: VCBS repeat-containing protein [Planctomycetota bacterium]|nr:VCBS repeat-containing protein [Planctomycetota bacterium]
MHLRLLFLLLLATPAAPQDKHPYGFRGFEIYKLKKSIAQLTACDVDGDGVKDLLIANNSRARIEVFLRRKEPVPPKMKAGDKLPNDIAYDQYYERKEILTEKQVWSMAAADLNGDGKIDVAYYGKPAELVVAYGDGKGGFAETRRFKIDDGAFAASGLAAGDLNGDKRSDLVLLAKTNTAIFFQDEKGTLSEPVRFSHTVKGVGGMRLADLDADGRLDLVLLVGNSARSVRARFQQKDGSLGAEIAFATSPWRAIDFVDLDNKPGDEILVIQRNSGVLRSLRLARKKAPALGTIEIHAFEKTRGSKPRAMAIGDLNGDGRNDIVVTEPGSAQVAVYFQDESGAMTGRKLFPSLSGTSTVRLADLSGDGKNDVIVMSSTEKAVGISSFRNGRLDFPRLIEVEGTPLALDTGDLNGDGKTDLAVIAELDKKRRAQIFLQQEKGGLGNVGRVVPLEKVKAADDLMIFDLSQNGTPELLIFDRYRSMRTLTATKDGNYIDVSGGSYRGGFVNKISRGSVNPADLDHDGKIELMVARKNYARVLTLVKAALTVREQVNGASPNSQVLGAAALDDGLVALYDKDIKAVTLLRRGQRGPFRMTHTLPVGDLDFVGMQAADVNGDQRKDLILLGKNRFGILYARGENREFAELYSVESTVRDARLQRFAVGDLNGNGQTDILVVDSANHGMQIFSYVASKGFSEQIHWRVYEKKMHQRSRSSDGAMELLIDDLDGDGKNDIALLVHDRLIVYIQ